MRSDPVGKRYALWLDRLGLDAGPEARNGAGPADASRTRQRQRSYYVGQRAERALGRERRQRLWTHTRPGRAARNDTDSGHQQQPGNGPAARVFLVSLYAAQASAGAAGHRYTVRG